MASAPVYFADENLLGFGKLMVRAGREDFLYPGHPSLPEVPLGTADQEWMKVVARRDLIVVSRDRRIRSRPAEQMIYREYGIRSVWIGVKQDLRPQDQVDLFMRHEAALGRMARKLGGGPWAIALGQNGPRPMAFKDL